MSTCRASWSSRCSTPSSSRHRPIDTDESPGSGNKFRFFTDGGWFVLQAGDAKVQVGGFQSPRGRWARSSRRLDPDWFQDGGVAGQLAPRPGRHGGPPGGDATLGTQQPVQFSDYFDRPSGRPGRDSGPAGAPQVPVQSDEYTNAFFLPFTRGST